VTGGEASGDRPRRRSVLALLGTSALLLTGCTRSRTHEIPAASPRIPSSDELAAGRAAVSARALLDHEALLAADRPALAPIVSLLAVAHRAHLAALGVPASVSQTARSPSLRVTSPTPADMIKAEALAAQQSLADVDITTSGTAGLLARIAASRLVDADLLAAAAKLVAPGEPVAAGRSTETPTSPSGSSSPALDPAAATGLSRLLQAEHAAVFAYGLITARVPDARRASARALWLSHRVRRDQLERALSQAGVTPPAALPAYRVGAAPSTPAQTAALAARVEDGMATVALATVTTTSGDVRNQAALDLIRAARRATGWRGTSVPLPG
jgi:hypothetical protein